MVQYKQWLIFIIILFQLAPIISQENSKKDQSTEKTFQIGGGLAFILNHDFECEPSVNINYGKMEFNIGYIYHYHYNYNYNQKHKGVLLGCKYYFLKTKYPLKPLVLVQFRHKKASTNNYMPNKINNFYGGIGFNYFFNDRFSIGYTLSMGVKKIKYYEYSYNEYSKKDISSLFTFQYILFSTKPEAKKKPNELNN